MEKMEIENGESSKIEQTDESAPITRRLRSPRVSSPVQADTRLKAKKNRLSMIPQTEKEITKYYLNKSKKGRTRMTNLETIFEEPKVGKGGEVVSIGGTKYKRSINFPDFPNHVTKAKQNARKRNILKHFKNSGSRKKKSKFTINDVKMIIAENELVHLKTDNESP